MATHDNTRQQDAAYREARTLLAQALDLLDGIDDSLTAAQLSHVIELVDGQIGRDDF